MVRRLEHQARDLSLKPDKGGKNFFSQIAADWSPLATADDL